MSTLDELEKEYRHQYNASRLNHFQVTLPYLSVSSSSIVGGGGGENLAGEHPSPSPLSTG